MNIFNFLGCKTKSNYKKNKQYNSIFTKLETLFEDFSQEDLRYIAAFSGLLGRVAYCDLTISDEELDRIKKILTKTTSLSEKKIAAVVTVMKNEIQALIGLENHLYTQEINELASHEKKMEVLAALFLVAAADKDISSYENEEIRKTSKALGFSHNEFILARSRFKNYLSVLKS